MLLSKLIELTKDMTDLAERFKLSAHLTGLGELKSKFDALPTQNISPTLKFSDLLGTIDNTSMGTVLNSGLPVAVIFNMKQYELIQKILNYIPSVIEKLQVNFNTRVEMRKIGEELMSTAAEPLLTSALFIGLGTILCIGGAFFLGRTYTKEKQDVNHHDYIRYVPAYVSLILGTAALGLSLGLNVQVGRTFASLAKAHG